VIIFGGESVNIGIKKTTWKNDCIWSTWCPQGDTVYKDNTKSRGFLLLLLVWPAILHVVLIFSWIVQKQLRSATQLRTIRMDASQVVWRKNPLLSERWLL
jgi:hypothetical protein